MFVQWKTMMMQIGDLVVVIDSNSRRKHCGVLHHLRNGQLLKIFVGVSLWPDKILPCGVIIFKQEAYVADGRK